MPELNEPITGASQRTIETQRRGQAFLRALPIMLIPIFVAVVIGFLLRATLAADLPKPPPNAPEPISPLIPLVVLIVFCTALIALVRFGRPNLSSVILIGGWTLVTTILGLQSSVNGSWAALLIVPICAAGLLIDGAASISLAALASLLVIGLAMLETPGISAPPGPFLPSPPPLVGIGFWIGIFWTVAALTYLLSSSMQRALKASRAQAEQLRELTASLEVRVQKQTAALLEQSRETAVMEERARVARDIHDTLAQGLTGIIVQLGAAQRAMQVSAQSAETIEPRATHDLGEHIGLAQEMARESLAEARRSIWNLRNASLERGELRDALAGLAERASHDTLRVSFETHGNVWALHADVESELLRVTQEALVNARKHARATQVSVNLEYLADAVRLTIHDNGVGWHAHVLKAAAQETNPNGGFGLIGMSERIAQWGGELKLTNDGGAMVEAIIPRVRAEWTTQTPKVAQV